MKKTGQLIASVAIAAMAMGTVGGGFLMLSASEAAAKSEKGESHSSDKGGSDGNRGANGDSHKNANAGSKSKGKGKYHKGVARYLKNLNAMCSNGKSTSANSNVAKINAFFAAHDAAAEFTGGADYTGAVGYLDDYDGEGAAFSYDFGEGPVPYSDMTDEQRQTVLDSLDPESDEFDALSKYDQGQDLLAAEHGALAAAVRGENRATALETAPEGTPEHDAYVALLNHCGQSS